MSLPGVGREREKTQINPLILAPTLVKERTKQKKTTPSLAYYVCACDFLLLLLRILKQCTKLLLTLHSLELDIRIAACRY